MPLLMPIPKRLSQYAANSFSNAASWVPRVYFPTGRTASKAARSSSAMAACQRVRFSTGTSRSVAIVAPGGSGDIDVTSVQAGVA